MLTNVPEHLGFLLHDISRQFRARFDEEARGLGVTRQQWRALLHLSLDEGQTQAELSDRLEVERITLCRMVDRLAEAGLVERRADPRDRRVWRLHLTDQARGLVQKLTAIGTRLESAAVAALTPARAEQLRATLLVLRDALKSHSDGREAA